MAATADLDSSNDYDVTGVLGEVKCVGSITDKPHCVKISTEEGNILFNTNTGADVTLIDFATYTGLSPRPFLRGTKAVWCFGASAVGWSILRQAKRQRQGHFGVDMSPKLRIVRFLFCLVQPRRHSV